MQIRAMREEWYGGIKFQIREGDKVVEKLVFKKFNEHEFTPEVGIIKIDKAQLLMDDLWNCGIRPTEGSGSAGSLKATEYHLEDMRKLVFHKKGEGK